ncbi:hypothetical protein RE628_12530 [Paenibacillus sp. D2_2]|uniref:hypothetical protein n=1 Tax=Paenibacillus sp. D2_2 TaxID=3073092 RepID=UPI0028162BBF|nr:hypothetical protein [Paenibacillus sp. D2_2]WMT43019.1 hypothetical protein RE628_12530 [Paenibacillus sp. D2_2]
MKGKYKSGKLVLTSLLVSSLMLAGCASNNEQSVNSPSPNASDSEVVTITTARQVGGDITFRDGEDIDNNVHYKWAQEKLGINFKNEWTVGTNDAFLTKLRLMLNTKEKFPDVIRLDDLKLATQLIDSGKIMDITDAFEKYASPA